MPSTPDAAAISVPVENQSCLGPLAAHLVAALPAHACVALRGDLGAGKTTFVKAVAAAAGIDPTEVVSPTFGLIHEHDAPAAAAPPIRLVHADFYRLPGVEELRETGWDDATAARPTTRVWSFIEWPERIAAHLPADRLEVSIGIDSETGRTFTFTSHGPTHDRVIAALRTFRTV